MRRRNIKNLDNQGAINDWPLYMAANEHYNTYKMIVPSHTGVQMTYDEYFEAEEEQMKANIKASGRDPDAFYGDVFGEVDE